MAASSTSFKRKRHHSSSSNFGNVRRPPKALGVLEFTSALNGDDPLLILQKLHQFVRVAEYQRRLVTASAADRGGVDGDARSSDDAHKSAAIGAAVNDINEESDGDDDASYISFDDTDDDDDNETSNKRQRLLQSSSITSSSSKHVKHSWKLDKNNYNVPFVGTSVTKGETGSITFNTNNGDDGTNNTSSTYSWPTGFMEVYRRYSPLGVELNKNEYISALPPGGVHKLLCKDGGNNERGDVSKDDDDGLNEGSGKKRRRKKRGGTTSTTASTSGTNSNDSAGQSRGKIISITLQTKYWLAVHEWILSFVPIEKLQREEELLRHHDDVGFDYYTNKRNDKCSLPPQIMTVLMKERLPEWIDVIYSYTARLQYYAQLQQKERREEKQRQKKLQSKQQQQKLSKEERVVEQTRQHEIQVKKGRLQRRLMKQQSREDALLLSAFHCLISLCHLSNGTAREVLRRLTSAAGSGSGGKSSAKHNIIATSHGGDGKSVGKGSSSGNMDTDWMVQLFQQGQKSSSSSNKLQTECLRLVCTLLETQDYIVLSRLTEVSSPDWAGKRGGGGKKDVGNFGIENALRYGIQRLLSIAKYHQEDEERDENDIDAYAICIARLLRGVNGIILPPFETKDQTNGNGGSKKSTFVIGMGTTADLLSGVVLSGLSELSLLAPPFDPTFESIQSVISGDDVYGDLDSIETTAVEARRLLFALLADTRRSPFLRDSSLGSTSDKEEDLFTAYLPQLSKALLTLLAQGHSVSLKNFLGQCLRTTPEMAPHFFRSLQLSDPKPNYRSLAAITFVEGVVRDIPHPRVRVSPKDGKTSTIDKVISEIIPNCVTKPLLAKVLQSSSALLTSGGLKLMITLLRRACGATYDESMVGENIDTARNEFQRSLYLELMRHMPELPILLSIPSRFDPFESTSKNGSSHPNTIVMLQLCEALRYYTQIDPSLVVNAKYDWVKFLPLDEPSGRSFFSAHPLLQYRILRTLRSVSKLNQMSFSSKMLPSALTIVTSASTTTPEVYDEARQLAISLLEQEIFPNPDKHDGADSSRMYESSLWIDAISEETIEDLMTMIGEVRQQSVQHKMTIFQAFSKANIVYDAASGVSSLLSLSLSYLMSKSEETKSHFSDEFGLCLIQISVKMLLFQANPMPLAAIIYHAATTDQKAGGKNAAALYQVAKALVDGDSNIVIHLDSLCSKLFHEECLLNCMLRVSMGKTHDIPRYNLTSETMRQCLSLLKYTSGDCREELFKLLRRTIVHICAVGGPGAVAEIETIVLESSLCAKDFEGIMFVLFSLSKASNVHCTNSELGESLLLKYSNETTRSMVAMKVVSSLLHHNVAPSNRHFTSTNDVWMECCAAVNSNDANKRLKHFLLTLVLRIFPDAKASVLSPPLAKAMFDLWASLVDDLDEELSVKVCLNLSDCLSEIFTLQQQGHLAWAIYHQNLCKMGIDTFVDSCLRMFIKQGELAHQPKHCFLASVMSYDSANFEPALASLLLGSDDKYELLWQRGLLDTVASTFVLRVFTQPNMDNRQIIAEKIGSRFLTLLTGLNYRDEHVLSIETIVDVLLAICSEGFFRSETVQCLLEIFDSFDNGNIALPAEQEVAIIRLVISITSKQDDASTSIIATKCFLRCCKLTPMCLKKLVRSKGTEKELASLVTSLIGATANLLERAHNFSDRILSSLSSSIVENCLVSCLKYGMTDTIGFTSSSVLGGCLKIIRLILSQVSGGKLSGACSIVPGQVHAMTISHSAFELLVSKTESATISKTTSLKQSDSAGDFQFCGGLSQQQELIRLLLCCVSLDADHVKISNDTWVTIMSAYNASTSAVDRLLRRLLFLYHKNNCFKDEILLCHYQWGSQCKKRSLQINNESTSPVEEQQNWDWFVDSINNDRIRSTLSQFPIAETLEPSAESDIEPTSRKAADVEMQSDDSGSESSSESDSKSHDSDSSSVASVEKPDKVTIASKINSMTDSWRGLGEDTRYSPGFILPLVLGALEATVPNELFDISNGSQTTKEMKIEENEENEEDDDDSEEDIAQHHAFSMMARRLCDRGCISLAIASLSSRCPSVRKIAVAICGLFLKALQLQESHGMKSWRERPQQEMIMASLQRGLAVRRAMQIKRREEGNKMEVELGPVTNTLKQRYNVPMLPAVSAVFLAKALLIVSKPSDDMYGAMNKYFLRLNDYHGAFQDCFGLPAFLSLYCSSSDDLARCRTERNWALLSLKDSVVDDFCYRIISQHHVPELILTSFGSACDLPGGKSELSLTIDVIQCLLESGGSRSASHLIKRLGLLSWLHGVISWRSISSVLPYVSLKCKFLKLITTAVESYREEYSNDTKDENGAVFLEDIPLANAIIRICLERSDTEINNSNASSKEAEAILAATCEALWAIFVASKKRAQSRQRAGLTSLRHMVDLLMQCVHSEELFAKALASTSALPYSVSDEDKDTSVARVFCELALSFILEQRGARLLCPDDTIIILLRVNDLMSKFQALDTELAAKIMQTRHVAAAIGALEVWDRFIPFLDEYSE